MSFERRSQRIFRWSCFWGEQKINSLLTVDKKQRTNLREMSLHTWTLTHTHARTHTHIHWLLSHALLQSASERPTSTIVDNFSGNGMWEKKIGGVGLESHNDYFFRQPVFHFQVSKRNCCRRSEQKLFRTTRIRNCWSRLRQKKEFQLFDCDPRLFEAEAEEQ